MSNEASEAALLKRLEEGSEPEVLRACEAVVAPADEAQRARLREALAGVARRGSPAAQAAALRGLGRLGQPGARIFTEVATVALRSPLVVPRTAATDALTQWLRSDEVGAPERGALRRALTALLRQHSSVAFRLCAVLGPSLLERSGPAPDDERELLLAAAAALADDKPPALRRSAAEALAALGPRARDAAPSLRAAAEAPAAAVALSALRALLALDPDSADIAPVLARLSRRSDLLPLVLQTCVDALQAGPSAAVLRAFQPASLRPLLDPASPPPVRQMACELLGALGGDADVEALLPLLRDESWAARVAARDALASMAERGAPVLDPVLALYRSPVATERQSAVELLGVLAMAAPEAREALRRATLDDPSVLVRDAAALLLRDDLAPEALIEALGSSQPPWRRRRAVQALLRAVSPATAARLVPHVPVLIEALRDPDARVRSGACSVLGLLAEAVSPAGPALLSLLLPALPGLLRRLADADAAPAAHVALEAFRPHLPAGIDLGPLLAPQPDWWAAYRRVFCSSSLPADPARWHALFSARLRWSSQILHQPAAPPPLADLCSTGELVARLGGQRSRRHRPRQPDRGVAQELAWMLAKHAQGLVEPRAPT